MPRCSLRAGPAARRVAGPRARRHEAVQPQRPVQRRCQGGAAQSRVRRVLIQLLPEVQVGGPRRAAPGRGGSGSGLETAPESGEGRGSASRTGAGGDFFLGLRTVPLKNHVFFDRRKPYSTVECNAVIRVFPDFCRIKIIRGL